MNQFIPRQARWVGLSLATLSFLQGCVSWPSWRSKLSSECQIVPPEKIQSDRETALKVAADLSALANAPIKADFEHTFKEKASQTFRALPDTYTACYMLLKTIDCVSTRPKTEEMVNRLFDYLERTNACESTNTSPVAIIELDSEKPCIREVTGNDVTRKFWNVYYCQVYIRNTSDRTILHAKHMKLTNLRQLDGDSFKPWPNVIEEAFVEWPPDKPKGIPPGDRVPVHFARIFPPELQRMNDEHLRFSGDVDSPQIRFMLKPWHRVMTSHVEPGTHRFKLTAFFENAPPAEAEFELAWPGNRRESPESIVQEVKIRKL